MKIILKADSSQAFTNNFTNCVALENLIIEGAIGQNGFNIQPCSKLTHDSLVSIINALQDKSTDTSRAEWKITIGATNLAKLTAEEIDIAKQKNWSVI